MVVVVTRDLLEGAKSPGESTESTTKDGEHKRGENHGQPRLDGRSSKQEARGCEAWQGAQRNLPGGVRLH